MRHVVPVLILACATSAGCIRTVPFAMTPVHPGSCRDESLRWFAPDDAGHRARLDAWCAGVGRPVIAPLDAGGDRTTPELTRLTFVSWNVHVGNGDISTFVRDLRGGKLTDGRRVEHFVLLLQEVERSDGVPPYLPGAEGAARIRRENESESDIFELSRQLKLSLVYVPSMRNGNSALDPLSDRGSAIVSTLPLTEPVAIELPGERQRRVVVIAKITLGDGGQSVPLSVGTIHLDAFGAPRRLWMFWTTWMRELQVKSMATLLPDGPLVIGADLNTWHGRDEPAARSLDRMFDRTSLSTERHGLGLRVLDYLFFRGAGTGRARYRQIADLYGSDHRPLIGWLE